MIVRSFFIGVFSALFLLAGLLPAHTVAQSNINLRAESQLALDTSNNIKLPDVAVAGKTVSVSGNNGTEANAWIKGESDAGFTRTVLGSADDDPAYTGAAVTGRPDGTFTYAWFETFSSARVLVRQRSPGGTFGSVQEALGPGAAKVFPDIATSTNGTTVVLWSQDGSYRYRWSTENNLGRWFGPGTVSGIVTLNQPHLAIGPSGQIGLAVGTGSNDIYFGLWNGSGFTLQPVAITGDNDFDPTVTFLPNGTPVVAWRRLAGDRDAGFFYSVRQGESTWPVSRLSSIAVFGPANVAADEAGNLSFVWTGTDGRLYAAYAATPYGASDFAGPIAISGSGDAYLISSAAANVTSRTQIHTSAERWSGSRRRGEYNLFTAQGAGTMGATPNITPVATLNGQPIVRGTSNLTVNFTEVVGSPNQIRWRWGQAPTDAAADSSSTAGGWVAFDSASPTVSVPVVSSVNIGDCRAETLFTQVRNGNTLESQAKQLTVIVDGAVGGTLRAVNPYIGDKLPVFTASEAAVPLDVGTNSGASDGDPNYTRESIFYMEVRGSSDCVGIKQFQYGADANSLSTPYGIVANTFANTLALPNPSNVSQGPRSIFVRLSDNASNAIDYTTTITFDSVKPVLGPDPDVTIASDPRATILATLTYSNVVVTDAAPGYPGGYWGAWVANSLTRSTAPLTDTKLIWTPLKLDNQLGTSPVLRNWSLFTGLGVARTALQPNTTIYVYTRFLDGAGNPTDGYIEKQITLATISFPTVYTPQLRR